MIPTDLFAGYQLETSDGAGSITGLAVSTEYVCIPRSEIHNLSSLNANASTGDAREVIFNMVEQLERSLNAYVGTAPTKVTATRARLSVTGDTTGNQNITFTSSVDITGFTLQAEPAS